MRLHSSPDVPEDILKWGDKLKMLMDAEFLRKELTECGSQRVLAKKLHIDGRTMRKALRYHRIIIVQTCKK